MPPVPVGEETFATRLVKLRHAQGYSIRELARLAKISPSTIEAWEKGRLPRHGPAIRRLAEVLRTTPGYLLDGDVQ